MSNKDALLLYKNKRYTRIDFCCYTSQYKYDDMISFIVKMLCCVAKGQNVFVEYYGCNPKLECPDNVIAQKKDTKSLYKKMLWVREKWLSDSEKSLEDERYTILYIFDNDYSWATFRGLAGGGLNNVLRIPQLQLLAIFGDCESPCLYIRHGNLALVEILDHFKNNCFVLKNRMF